MNWCLAKFHVCIWFVPIEVLQVGGAGSTISSEWGRGKMGCFVRGTTEGP